MSSALRTAELVTIELTGSYVQISLTLFFFKNCNYVLAIKLWHAAA